MRIAFHSYKGGVGRTKIMIGTAALLAMKGHRVGLLDFDLDASGLATIFQADPDQVGDRELLHILGRNDPVRALDAMLSVTELLEERFGRKPKGAGKLQYIPTISNPRLSDRVKLDDAATRAVIPELLDLVLKETGIDILMIDLKPGYSPSSGAIFPLVGKAVVVTRLDNQNIAGLRQTIPIMVERGLDPVLVANLVPDSSRSDERVKELEEATNHRVDVRINYDPEAVFDDDIAFVAAEASPMRLGMDALIGALGLGET